MAEAQHDKQRGNGMQLCRLHQERIVMILLIVLGIVGAPMALWGCQAQQKPVVAMAVSDKTSRRETPAYKLTDLGVPSGFKEPAPYAINSQGQVLVIATRTSDQIKHSFLWKEGTFRDLGTLGGPNCEAWGLNDRGQAVGRSDTSRGEQHAFLWQDGKMQDLGTLGGNSSYAASINNRGQVVGQAEIHNRPGHAFLIGRAFLWESGKMQNIGKSIAGYASAANKINDTGDIVGIYHDENYGSFPFHYSQGKVTKPPKLFGGDGAAKGINNQNDIVGYRDVKKGEHTFMHACLYSKGKTLDLGTLGGWMSSARCVNNNRQIVGDSDLKPGEDKKHPFLWQEGKMIDLNTLLPVQSGWEAQWAFDINDKGQIVGSGVLDGQIRAFMMSPMN